MTYPRLARAKVGGGGVNVCAKAAVPGGPQRGQRGSCGYVPHRSCLHRSLRFQAKASPPAFSGDSPGHVAAPVRSFHLQDGVAGNTEKERAFRVW